MTAWSSSLIVIQMVKRTVLYWRVNNYVLYISLASVG